MLKPFNEYSKDELAAIYFGLFGFEPCKTCNGVDWEGVYNSIKNKLDKNKNKKFKNFAMEKKFIWNSKYIGCICFVDGLPIKVGDEVEQNILEKIFNNKKLLPLVILNPNFKDNKNIEKSKK